MIRITISKVLTESVAEEQEFSEMTDEQIIELCHEDLLDIVIEGASWKVERL
jgi:hypothetical protein